MSCWRWRRPPAGGGGRASPARRGSSPASRPAPRRRFGPGMALDVLPGCPSLAVAADAAGEDGGFAGVSEGELVGVLCAWDRVEAHAAARKLAVAAELIRRNPRPGCEPEGPSRMPAAWDEFTADLVAYSLAESRSRAEVLLDLAQTLQTRLPGTRAALDDGTITRSKAEIIARATALLDDAEARAAEAGGAGPGRAADARRAARRDRPRRDGSRPGEGKGTPRDRGQGRAGGAVDRGFRQRRADGLRAAPGRGPGRRPADHRLGEGTGQGRAGGRHGPAPRPRLPRPAPRQRLPPASAEGRARAARMATQTTGTTPGQAMARAGRRRQRGRGAARRRAGSPAGSP